MNELIFFINKALIGGLTIGSIYALGAVGVTLVFAILRFAHFAHGELMTVGAFAALALVAAFPSLGPALGMPTAILMLPPAAVIAAVVAIGADRWFYRPLRAAGVKPIALVMASIGVTLMLQGLVRLIYGTGGRSLYVEDRKAVFRFEIEGARQKIVVTEPQIWLFALTVIAVVALHYFLTRSRLGKAMRAVSDNPDLARVSGVDAERVVAATWAIGGGLAALAGVMLALDVTLKPDLAYHLLLPIFAAAIVGGVGQPYGAILGGYLVGFVETLAVFNWAVLLRPFESVFGFEAPFSLSLVATEYKIAAPFVVLILVLIFRPTGLFRGKTL